MLEGLRAELATINPTVADLTYTFLSILMWAIILRSLLSFFPVDQSSPLFQMLHRVTEPLIDPLRRVIPNMGMLDFSPFAAIIVLIVMQAMVQSVRQPY